MCKYFNHPKAIYTVPSLISTTQNLTKFADAPDCHGLAVPSLFDYMPIVMSQLYAESRIPVFAMLLCLLRFC